MQHAPSVTYPVGRARLPALLLAGLWLLGAAVLLLWSAQVDAVSWRQGLCAIVLAAAGAVAVLDWRTSPAGALVWDGEIWSCTGVAAELQVVTASVDLQRCLLLCLQTPQGRRWLWLERRRCPRLWDDLRRAVHSRARPDLLPAATTPAAKT